MKSKKSSGLTTLNFVDSKGKSVQDLDTLKQSFNDQMTSEKDQSTLTTKTTIFSTQVQNSNFTIAIHNNTCLLL
jgi:hypothetical protein